MKTLFVSLSLPFVLFLTACGNADTADLREPPVREKPIELDVAIDETPKLSEEFSPKVEMIFIVDNSQSMETHIRNASNNIDRFVDGFTRNSPFQFNVAVMSVYDSRRYNSTEYKTQFGGTELEFDIGEFRQVKDGGGNKVANKYFISSDDQDVAGMLKSTLKVGVQTLDTGGPNDEEMFSPLAATYNVLGKKQSDEVRERQKDFFLGNDSYKVFFFITDASDGSFITASDIHTNLLAKFGGDRKKMMSFGALSINGCQKDPGTHNNEIQNFLKLTKPTPSSRNLISLCSDFGNSFANFGNEIRKKILSQEIPLTMGIPDVAKVAKSHESIDDELANAECLKPMEERNAETLVVCYGAQRIYLRTQQNGPAGYRINPRNNSISLDEDFVFDPSQQGASLTAVYHTISKEVREKNNVGIWGQ